MGDRTGIRKKVSFMKGIEVLLIAVMVALVVVAVPLVSQKAYAADYGRIELLVPAESGTVETGGGETPWMPLKSFAFGNDTGRIELLLAAESQEVEVTVGGGETPYEKLAPVKMGHDAGYIERLLPAESAE
jgi:hypothetical protein